MLKKISENEYRVGDNSIILKEDNIIYIISRGDATAEIADAVLRAHKSILSKYQGKVSHLINLNKAGKHSSEARKIWKKLSEHEKTHKVAIFGAHPVAKVIASFVIGVTNKKDIRFFTQEEEALNWLNS
jgi:hypothetical protein